jgi:hypothetical protein
MVDNGVLASAAFLVAVLWFDLMFDVQVLRHRSMASVPVDVVASIRAYYRRVLIDSSPMGRMVGVVMLVFTATLIAQTVAGDVARWVSVVSWVGFIGGPGLAAARVVRNARRLALGHDDHATQSTLARRICSDHLVCLVAMTTTVVAQILA